MREAQTTIASLRSVTKNYGAIAALKEVNLDVRAGELLAVLGPNGAGKTTSIRLLLGLSQPGSGEVRVFGRDPRRHENRTRVGAMLQVARVPETLRVREHISLFRSYYPDPLPFAEIVGSAGLDGMENRLFGSLSGGEKQRVLFALAICGNPQLIFLDEPTVGLDVGTRHLIWQQIRKLTSQGRTVVLTTHYLEEGRRERCVAAGFARRSPDIAGRAGAARAFPARSATERAGTDQQQPRRCLPEDH